MRIVYCGCLLAIVLLQSESISFAKSSASNLLNARSLTEKQYLNLIPDLCPKLYGPMAVPAAKLLWKNPGPVFAVDAMTRAYGEIWTLKGPLTVNERSLATVSALVAQGLYPQIKLHINGFISSGATLEQLYALVGIVASQVVSKIPEALVDAVVDGLKWRQDSIKGFTAPSKDEVRKALSKSFASHGDNSISPQMLLLANLSAEIAYGSAKEFSENNDAFNTHMDKMRNYMSDIVKGLPSEVNRDKYMDLLITHLIVYCGYPKGMNASTVWQQLRSSEGVRKG